MSSVRAEVYATLYKNAVEVTVKTAESVPEANYFRQAEEGKAHPLWLLGHMTMSLDMLTNHWTLGRDLEIPQSWAATFGPSEFGGKPITTNPEDYPSWDEVLAAYKKAGATTVEGVAAVTDEQLEGYALGPQPEQFKEAFGILNKSIPDNAVHNTHHRGQLSLLGGLS